MTLPKILLIEDDASITQFVRMALEDLEIELLACTNVADAWRVLEAGGIRLVLTDLMLPGESGIDLMHRLRNHAGSVPAVPVAVFSAGLTPPVRDKLTALGVWRMLSKPIPVMELEGCVREALALVAAPAAAPSPPVSAVQGAPGLPPLTLAESEAVTTHFGGDERLFRAYRASCHAQFAADVRQGDAAHVAGDWQALRRLAHSLGTVLLTLGHPDGSAMARALEDVASEPDVAACQQGWARLRAFLTTL